MLWKGHSNGCGYPTLVSTVSTQCFIIPNSTMPLEDTSNCQAGYE